MHASENRLRLLALLLPTLAVWLLLSANATAQNTIHVPGNHATIKGAIDAVADGDTVLVSIDIHPERIHHPGEAVALTSKSGPEERRSTGAPRVAR